MGHEPSGTVGAKAEHSPKLMGAHALLGSAHEVGSEQPLVQRDMRTLIQRAHGGCEGLLTGAALVEAGARALALEFGGLVDGAAMRADRAIRPAKGFEMLPGCIFVSENRVSKIASHGQFLRVWPKNYNPQRRYVKCIILQIRPPWSRNIRRPAYHSPSISNSP